MRQQFSWLAVICAAVLVSAGQVAACTTSADCSSTMPICAGDVCRGCISDAECGGNSDGPACQASGACGPAQTDTVTPTPTQTCQPTGTPYCSDDCGPSPTAAPGCSSPGGGQCFQNPSCNADEVCVMSGFSAGCCRCATLTPTLTPSTDTVTPTPTPSCQPTGTPYCSANCGPSPTIAPGCNSPGGGPCFPLPSCNADEACVPGFINVPSCCACATLTPTFAPTSTLTPTPTLASTPEDSGFVPPDKNTLACESATLRNVKRLAVCMAKCHLKQATKAVAGTVFDEEACEQGTGPPVSCRAAYDKASAAILAKGICPPCLTTGVQSNLASLVTNFFEQNNGQMYCAGTTPLPN
jgi:hypothetical protein